MVLRGRRVWALGKRDGWVIGGFDDLGVHR
jgi:hypothetical protein